MAKFRSRTHPSQIARETEYYQKTVQDTISEMALSGMTHQRIHGREKRYSLDHSLVNFITGGRPVKTAPWNLLYELLVRLNYTVRTAAEKGISLSSTFALCQKEISRIENNLLSAGFSRDVLRIHKMEDLSKMIRAIIGVR